MGNRLKDYSIKKFARAAHVSIPSVHRFCKTIGLEGFKELKIEIARAEAFREGQPRDFCCAFTHDWDDNMAALASAIPYTKLNPRPASLSRGAQRHGVSRFSAVTPRAAGPPAR